MAKTQLILSDFLPYRLSVLSNRISDDIGRIYSERFNMTLPEWRVMAVLGEETDISASMVAERTAMDKVAVSRAVKRSLDAGRLVRHFASDDKRRSVLALSADGRAIYDQICPLAKHYESQLLAGFTKEERRQIDTLLNKLSDMQRQH